MPNQRNILHASTGEGFPGIILEAMYIGKEVLTIIDDKSLRQPNRCGPLRNLTFMALCDAQIFMLLPLSTGTWLLYWKDQRHFRGVSFVMIWDASKYLVRFGKYLPRQRIDSFLEWSAIRDVLHRYAINCVLDVGASRGQFARNLRKIGYKGFICSFEPIPEEFEILSKAMQHDPKWLGYKLALGSEDTNQTFHIAVESTVMSSFLQHKDHSANMRDIDMEVRQLDSVFEEAISSVPEPRIFLKLDTQGYDLEVVRGAEKSIEQILCLQSEVSVDPIYDDMPHYLAALETYEGLGFHLGGLFEVARIQAQSTIVEMNCLMVRPKYAV